MFIAISHLPPYSRMGNKSDKPKNEPENKSGQKQQVPWPSDHTVSRSGQEQHVPSLSDRTVSSSGQEQHVPSPSGHTVSSSGWEQHVFSPSDHTVDKPQEQVVHPNRVSVCTCTCVLCLRVPPNTRDSLANQLHTILSLE